MYRQNALILCLATVPLSATSQTPPPAGFLDCQLSAGGQQLNWIIEYNESLPLAVVDEEDKPALYTPSHIQIRMAPEGPIVTIGRVSGRILKSADTSNEQAFGRCQIAAQTQKET